MVPEGGFSRFVAPKTVIIALQGLEVLQRTQENKAVSTNVAEGKRTKKGVYATSKC